MGLLINEVGAITKKHNNGRNPNARELREAERITQLQPQQQRSHPSAIPSDIDNLAHINTYGELPDYYIDRDFICRSCGKQEIWKARDQKWYYEEAKGHIDAVAVECHDCRISRKTND